MAHQQAAQFEMARETQQKRSPRAWALWEELCAATDDEKALDKNVRARLESLRSQVWIHIEGGGEASEGAVAEIRKLAGLEVRQ